MTSNIHPKNFQITKADRLEQIGHKNCVLWFTGLSGSGKSTLADKVEKMLFEQGFRTYVLDGDNLRDGLNKDLGFSQEDRSENIRRVAEVSKLMLDSGCIVLAAFVSPYKKDRDQIKRIVEDVNFVEVYVEASLEICESRDVKGLYAKARAGKISNMTGISAPYEIPQNPSLVVNTEKLSIDEGATKIVEFILPRLKP